MKVVILAAGMGTRLGVDIPKPLVTLSNGKSILQLQLQNIAHFVPLCNVFIVVGYRKELIVENFSTVNFVDNSRFSKENTSKSLLRGLIRIDDDVLWMNGDVVFDYRLLNLLFKSKNSCMAVNKSRVGVEEVKYITDNEGRMLEVSKHIKNVMGEAVGINLFKKRDLGILKKNLVICEDNDYFEKAIELSIKKDRLSVFAIDISYYNCVEVDFPKDLEEANKILIGGIS